MNDILNCGISMNCRSEFTAGIVSDIELNIDFLRRTGDASLKVFLPTGIEFSPENVFINVIGRGDVRLTELEQQYIGKVSVGFERPVGRGKVIFDGENTVLSAEDLDLRPDNGTDIIITLKDSVFADVGDFDILATAEVTHFGAKQNVSSSVTVRSVNTVTDLCRVCERVSPTEVTSEIKISDSIHFTFPKITDSENIILCASSDKEESWRPVGSVSDCSAEVRCDELLPDTEYWFRLKIDGGIRGGFSNIVKAYNGIYNVRKKQNLSDSEDSAPIINATVDYLNSLGGGAMLLDGEKICLSTVFLKSNVHIFIAENTVLEAFPNCSNEEKNWFTDEKYLGELGDIDPETVKKLPENWTTKQDEGHSVWQNALFYGCRVENVAIVGGGHLNGNGVLTRENEFSERPDGYHADKIFSFKLCRDIEIGGFSAKRDLWYEETRDDGEDQPFYLEKDGSRSDIGIGNMMRVSEGGHFVLLATGVDGLFVHDIYTNDGVEIRDILDIMGCRDVVVTNIYTNTTHDDIVKLGSDCSLGFSRISENIIVRNIIADTGCNVFQIGSETACDINYICVDNIYVMGCGKAGFSTSVNDGGNVKGLHLNCGGTVGKCCCGSEHGNLSVGYEVGAVHPKRSLMRRTRMPFFITVSNRGRTLGAKSSEYEFVNSDGKKYVSQITENVIPGKIENVYLAHFDFEENYWGSRAVNNTDNRWVKFTDQPRTTPLIMGLKVPEGLDFKFPDGSNVSLVKNVILEDVNITVKGGNPPEDSENCPPEQIGMTNGQKFLSRDDRGSGIPSHGLYIRHAEDVTLKDYRVFAEKEDGRPAVVFDNTKNIHIENSPYPVLRYSDKNN